MFSVQFAILLRKITTFWSTSRLSLYFCTFFNFAVFLYMYTTAS